MKKPYELIPKPQAFQTMKQIRENYGKKYVLAHSCKVENGIVLGGHVFAVSIKEGVGFKELKAMQKNLRETRKDLYPIYRFCLDDQVNDILTTPTTTDDEVPLPEIKEKINPILEAIKNMPDEMLAGAFKTTIHNE